MLIKFELENYRSVRDSMELSLVAVNYYKEQKEQLISDAIPGLSGLRYLRSAALFGPNASGKTTIIKAFETMRWVTLNSATMPAGASLPYNPFKLEKGPSSAPTRFMVAFTTCDIRYEYEFSYVANTIVGETLKAFPKGREQVWFTRSVEMSGEAVPRTRIKDSSYLKIPAALHPLLNDNALLLSLLANYPKYEESAKIRPVFDWFNEDLVIVDRGPRSEIDYPFSGEILYGEIGTDFQRVFIQEMMRKADVGIAETRVEKVPVPEGLRESDFLKALNVQDFPEEFKTVVFDHDSLGEKISLSIGEESDGTYNLFCLSGYIAQALENGSTLLVDELDASLHPVLVREVIRCFLDPRSNPHNAQLVFTAHNPCLLDEDMLRRDQVWLTEKSHGATTLYPLSEFSPRKDESLTNGYLMGRYSATPLVPACFGRCGAADEGDVYGS